MTMSVTEAVEARHSIRAFLDKPVSEATLRDILDVARKAPSGGNLQPWRVFILSGSALVDLKEAVRKQRSTGEKEGLEYVIFPNPLKEPYNTLRKQCGEDMYASIRVPREDKAGRARQFDYNYEFFGAPVGVIFALDRSFGHAQWVHLGMFMQTVMLLAQEAGLATCAQEAWAGMHKTISQQLKLPPELMVCCGMSIGYADPSHPINGFVTDRMGVGDFATFEGF